MNQETNKQKLNHKLGANLFYALLLGWQLSFFVLVPVVGFLLLGFWADNYFKTFPLLAVIGSVFGIFISIFELSIFVKTFLKKPPPAQIREKTNA